MKCIVHAVQNASNYGAVLSLHAARTVQLFTRGQIKLRAARLACKLISAHFYYFTRSACHVQTRRGGIPVTHMELPGRIGYSILSDESIQFVRQPLAYLNSHRKQYGDVFVGRVMNKPTVFVTSSKAVRELLNGV